MRVAFHRKGLSVAFLAAGLIALPNYPATAQNAVDSAATGDAPQTPGPLATDLSGELRPKVVRAVMKKVADWQLSVAEPKFNQQWTFAALYDGLLAASKATGDPKYHDAVLAMAERFHWQLLDNRFPHADDEAIGQAYLDLYREHPDPAHLAATKAIMDRLIVRPDDPDKLLWWWCDALFMAPPVLARMSAVTGDPRYDAFLAKEWAETSASLYSPTEHLFFRDSRYFTQHEANGKPIFWSRGNGWVMGAFAKVLEVMPANDPARPKLEAQFREMAAKLASIQGPDGLWRSGLLDAASYEQPEVSGSAFFTYGMAWGINHGLLPRVQYEPVVRRAWAAMVKHIYADGRLGSIQPIDGQPGHFLPSASYVYGVGGFLLAGSEVVKLAR